MKAPRSLLALQTEMVINNVVISMAVISLFFQDIGLTQAQVGMTQAMFTGIMIVLNVLFGKLADRFNRRLFNVCGDIVTAAGFGLYAVSSNFRSVLIAEVMIGVGRAMSFGVDMALLRGYCDAYRLDYRTQIRRVSTIAGIAASAGMLLAGVLGEISLRLPFVVDAVLFAVGAVLSWLVVDHAERMPKTRLVSLLRSTLQADKRLASRVYAVALVRESTHSIIWLYGPLILLAGGSTWLVGAAWSISVAMRAAGSHLTKHVERRSDAAMLSVPLMLKVMGVGLSCTMRLPLIVTAIGLFGVAVGMSSVASNSVITRASREDAVATTESIARTLGHVIYVPAVLVVNALSDTVGPAAAIAVNGTFFVTAGAIAIRSVSKYSP